MSLNRKYLYHMGGVIKEMEGVESVSWDKANGTRVMMNQRAFRDEFKGMMATLYSADPVTESWHYAYGGVTWKTYPKTGTAGVSVGMEFEVPPNPVEKI